MVRIEVARAKLAWAVEVGSGTRVLALKSTEPAVKGPGVVAVAPAPPAVLLSATLAWALWDGWREKE